MELLEDRLAPANLRITGALLVDRNNSPITAPLTGEMVFIRAEYTTTDLTSANQFVVRFSVDGIPANSSTITGQPGVDRPFNSFRGGWFTGPGQHSVEVTVAETDETDNTTSFTFSPAAPTSLPGKFIRPVAGIPGRDWSLTNYVDVDPRTSQVRDYTGGSIAYDGHDAHDIAPPDFARMDAGVPVYAALAGTVTFVQDGNFDRETAANPRPPNFVTVTHGNGWVTQYFHLLAHSIAVKVGDSVPAGQLLGFAGSSGNSSGVHLHFVVLHNGHVVEPQFDPASYWVSASPYQGTAPHQVMQHGVTNYSINPDGQEGPSQISVFPATYNGVIYTWFRFNRITTGDTIAFNWYRPTGALETTQAFTAGSSFRGGYYFAFNTRPWSAFPGTWQVAMVVNGTELDRVTFQLMSTELVPEIKVTQASTYVLDERTTPLDFGSVPLGGAAPQRVFTILNHGYVPLTVSNLVLPPGFSLVGSFPSSIAPNGTATFTVQMDTLRAGAKFGQVRFDTNDPDESPFNFNLKGTITGAAPPGAPVITLPDPALAYTFGQAARVIDTQATLADSDSPHFDTGSLTVEFAAGGTASDRLAIRHQGTGPGQIGVSGVNVTFEGAVIGTFNGGVGTSPLVITFNSNATAAAVQALMRNVTFANVLMTPTTAPRYVRYTVTDEAGNVSNQPYTLVALAPNPMGVFQFSAPIYSASEEGGSILITVTRTQGSQGAVSVNYSTSNGTAAAGSDYTSVSGTLTFTNGQTSATFTIPILEDAIAEGEETVNLTLSNPTNGAALSTQNAAVLTIVDNDTATTLRVTSLTPTSTGFVVHLSQLIDLGVLNLYGNPEEFGSPDVVVTGNTTGFLRGSFIKVDPPPDPVPVYRWIQTGGILAADTYTVRLRSASNGFRTPTGDLLDGNGDGTAGDDFLQTFIVGSSSAVVVSVPDFMRGPGQAVNVPAGGAGLPLRLSDGAGVTSVSLALNFQPALLSITAATVGPAVPTGASVMLTHPMPGRVVVTFSSPTALSPGAINFVLLTTTVPNNAGYTSKQVLNIVAPMVNSSAALDDDGLHIAGYFGDTTGNGSYSSADALAVMQVAVGRMSGFAAYQLADPVILADVTGNGVVNSTDGTRILQEALGLDRPEIPPTPFPPLNLTIVGPDPLLSLPKRLRGRPGGLIAVPVNLTPSEGLESADLVLSYDPSLLDVVDVRRGRRTRDFDLFAVNHDPEAGMIRIGLGRNAGPISGRGDGSVVEMVFRIKPDAPAGRSIINLRQSLGSTTTQLNEGGLDLNPNPSDQSGDALDGLIAIQRQDNRRRQLLARDLVFASNEH